VRSSCCSAPRASRRATRSSSRSGGRTESLLAKQESAEAESRRLIPALRARHIPKGVRFAAANPLVVGRSPLASGPALEACREGEQCESTGPRPERTQRREARRSRTSPAGTERSVTGRVAGFRPGAGAASGGGTVLGTGPRPRADPAAGGSAEPGFARREPSRPVACGWLREELRGDPLPHERAPAPGGGRGLVPPPGSASPPRWSMGPAALRLNPRRGPPRSPRDGRGGQPSPPS
jgi:hypothetical protein